MTGKNMIPADDLAAYLRAVIAYDEHRWKTNGTGRVIAFRNLLGMIDPYEPRNGGFKGAAFVVNGLLADETDQLGHSAHSSDMTKGADDG